MTANSLTRHPRRGYSLIEVVTAMTAGTVVTGVAVALMYTLLRFESSSRDYFRQRTTVVRLREQFCRDAHAAARFVPVEKQTPAAQGPAWSFEFDDGRVAAYRVDQGNLVRVERGGENVLKQSSYPFPAAAAASLEILREGDPPIVSLRTAARPAEPGTSGLQPICIDAALGKDRRFLKSGQP